MFLKKSILIAVFTLISLAYGNDRPPFLILNKIPHLSSILKTNWNNPELKLTVDQKVKLLKVRQDTIKRTSIIKHELASLEDEIASSILENAQPLDLYATVEEVAELKTEATKIHLQCIYQTKKILTQAQLVWLLK